MIECVLYLCMHVCMHACLMSMFPRITRSMCLCMSAFVQTFMRALYLILMCVRIHVCMHVCHCYLLAAFPLTPKRTLLRPKNLSKTSRIFGLGVSKIPVLACIRPFIHSRTYTRIKH